MIAPKAGMPEAQPDFRRRLSLLRLRLPRYHPARMVLQPDSKLSGDL